MGHSSAQIPLHAQASGGPFQGKHCQPKPRWPTQTPGDFAGPRSDGLQGSASTFRGAIGFRAHGLGFRVQFSLLRTPTS